jgi:hypothetical protein
MDPRMRLDRQGQLARRIAKGSHDMMIMNHEAVVTYGSDGNDSGAGRIALSRSHGDNLVLLTVADGATGDTASVLLAYDQLVRVMAQAGAHLASGEM